MNSCLLKPAKLLCNLNFRNFNLLALSSNSILASRRPNLYQLSNESYSVKVKTPTNSHKTFRPTTVPVTKANQHLEIELFDENNADLGKMSMQAANERRLKNPVLKLVIIDEKTSPPKFKLMTGSELFQLQMTSRENSRTEKELNDKPLKQKEIDLNLGISDHDLEIKLKMAQNFYEKGHSIKIVLSSKIFQKKVFFRFKRFIFKKNLFAFYFYK